jgi:hypothetical protein
MHCRCAPVIALSVASAPRSVLSLFRLFLLAWIYLLSLILLNRRPAQSQQHGWDEMSLHARKVPARFLTPHLGNVADGGHAAAGIAPELCTQGTARFARRIAE